MCCTHVKIKTSQVLPRFNSAQQKPTQFVYFIIIFTHLLRNNINRNLPVKSNFVPELLLVDISVQEVVADVGGRPFHPLHEDLPLRHIEVVLQKGSRVLTLPVKLLGDVTPKFCKGNARSP